MGKFEKREAHPLKKYVGRLVNHEGEQSEVAGHSCNESAEEPLLMVDASQIGGWSALALKPFDVVFKNCEKL